MALPFVLGLAVGAGVVVAYNKSDKLKEKANKLFNKSKNVANESIERGKEAVNEVKQTINATADCIKERKEKTAIASNKDEKIIEDKNKE